MWVSPVCQLCRFPLWPLGLQWLQILFVVWRSQLWSSPFCLCDANHWAISPAVFGFIWVCVGGAMGLFVCFCSVLFLDFSSALYEIFFFFKGLEQQVFGDLRGLVQDEHYRVTYGAGVMAQPLRVLVFREFKCSVHPCGVACNCHQFQPQGIYCSLLAFTCTCTRENTYTYAHRYFNF